MDFTVFDTKKMDEYAKEARRSWGKTEAYREFEERQKGKTKESMNREAVDMMAIFTEFGRLRAESPDSPAAQAQAAKLQAFITARYYTCTKEILAGLGKLYAGGGTMTENIDAAGGPGTAEFAAAAIEIYCR